MPRLQNYTPWPIRIPNRTFAKNGNVKDQQEEIRIPACTATEPGRADVSDKAWEFAMTAFDGKPHPFLSRLMEQKRLIVGSIEAPMDAMPLIGDVALAPGMGTAAQQAKGTQ